MVELSTGEVPGLGVLSPRDKPVVINVKGATELRANFLEHLRVEIDGASCQPVLEDMEGWSSPTSGLTDLARFPAAARRYLERIEALAGVPVELVSTGPERDQTIVLRSPFDVREWCPGEDSNLHASRH